MPHLDELSLAAAGPAEDNGIDGHHIEVVDIVEEVVEQLNWASTNIFLHNLGLLAQAPKSNPSQRGQHRWVCCGQSNAPAREADANSASDVS